MGWGRRGATNTTGTHACEKNAGRRGSISAAAGGGTQLSSHKDAAIAAGKAADVLVMAEHAQHCTPCKHLVCYASILLFHAVATAADTAGRQGPGRSHWHGSGMCQSRGGNGCHRRRCCRRRRCHRLMRPLRLLRLLCVLRLLCLLGTLGVECRF